MTEARTIPIASVAPRRDPAVPALERVRAYHERTKHRLDGYAKGPETIDWSSPPDPFRHFEGSFRLQLALSADALTVNFDELGSVAPAAPTLAAIGALLELSFALAAWKEAGPDRWSLRCAPSSGNLHPTETYVIARGIDGLADGVWHYLPREHALEHRAHYLPAHEGAPLLQIGLTSIHWREAWKYGERAFRYCQLDMGHALGTLRYAAACLGWSARLNESISSDAIAARIGTDRADDFKGVEHEDAEGLVEIGFGSYSTDVREPVEPAFIEWVGSATRVDRWPMYKWPVIDDVARATQRPPLPRPAESDAGIARRLPAPAGLHAPTLIRNRRSAQQFDRKHTMRADQLWPMLDALVSPASAPLDVWAPHARVHPVLFVHRVDGLAPGVYALPRSTLGHALLRMGLDQNFAWTRVEGAPEHLPLYRLNDVAVQFIARRLSCGQAIAGDCCVAWAFVAEFDDALADSPWRYRDLHWEAGLLGQALYLEAEAAGLRGTGIGCFFDDSVHEALGITGTRLQTVYHFSLGLPLTDARIRSEAPYAHRDTLAPSPAQPTQERSDS
ncbi:nitroreductase family protein [Derxia gummosa]|uniref:Nitroreductase family protein n=1 Tax=Derxia gummosa DSM 723 TaxID=1121388 RepID=A0A8B6XAI6_9BURK|nr:nitroreductase family protein [Derxia gummosa]